MCVHCSPKIRIPGCYEVDGASGEVAGEFVHFRGSECVCAWAEAHLREGMFLGNRRDMVMFRARILAKGARHGCWWGVVGVILRRQVTHMSREMNKMKALSLGYCQKMCLFVVDRVRRSRNPGLHVKTVKIPSCRRSGLWRDG